MISAHLLWVFIFSFQESISDFYWYYSGKDIIDDPGKRNFSKAMTVAKQVFNSLTEYIQVHYIILFFWSMAFICNFFITYILFCSLDSFYTTLWMFAELNGRVFSLEKMYFNFLNVISSKIIHLGYGCHVFKLSSCLRVPAQETSSPWPTVVCGMLWWASCTCLPIWWWNWLR